ncbi:hypothetical protein K466DRAFT_665396 [Polyporus arcularius HHB13444]|uniref:Uncharacterized protein n=1 Tax=Polyporus arcularius HHB13444 TaxID=1314778 RepID=A0A5C3P353_9APHY|nr:hypothetical protein K466DRAFT_665396 [Polyporus arcularius HHB13444]
MEGPIKGLKKEHSHKSSSRHRPECRDALTPIHPASSHRSRRWPFTNLSSEHTRHKIKRADYPAVLPYSRSRELFASSGHAGLPPEERTVRGTFVQGFNDHDIHLLDLFEGDEYTRENVEVHALGPLTSLSSTPVPTGKSSISSSSAAVPLDAPSLPPLDAPSAPLPAETYIYAGPLTDLSPELWSLSARTRGSGSGAARTKTITSRLTAGATSTGRRYGRRLSTPPLSRGASRGLNAGDNRIDVVNPHWSTQDPTPAPADYRWLLRSTTIRFTLMSSSDVLPAEE